MAELFFQIFGELPQEILEHSFPSGGRDFAADDLGGENRSALLFVDLQEQIKYGRRFHFLSDHLTRTVRFILRINAKFIGGDGPFLIKSEFSAAGYASVLRRSPTKMIDETDFA